MDLLSASVLLPPGAVEASPHPVDLLAGPHFVVSSAHLGAPGASPQPVDLLSASVLVHPGAAEASPHPVDLLSGNPSTIFRRDPFEHEVLEGVLARSATTSQ